VARGAVLKPLGRTAEIIDLVRRGLKRERLESDGVFKLPLSKEDGAVTGLGKPLKILTHPERDTIPIWIAALGPKSVEQAATIADGWIPHLFHPEKSHLVWGDALEAGRAQRSPDLAPLQVTAGGMVAIGEGPETKALLDFARPLFALYVGGMGAKGKNFYNDVARSYGYEQEAEEIQDLYLAGHKKEAEAKVPTEWLEASNLVGPASYVKERIAAFQEAGVTHLTVMPASDDPAATVAQVKEWVA
jgi:F420-dependent oxidoreductase-like protein